MPRFIVRFLKDVLGENGHCVEVCQSSLEIEAPDGAAAGERAKHIFCIDCDLTDWSLHADRIDIREADYPS
ncbi:hypothetical protein [Bradyrhizobium sp. WD16]|uniref:hypothetical protein n=1 Tax=Bradyrhizobium sp. WD16 TaxID=1521768 RepID=UPI0020A53932|nr:hypothetical protein [Bradyrhizobium sp. WD16]UTD28177.1 hypothetical protein DB459_16030 [Bradyrhizobium sp. WD16]